MCIKDQCLASELMEKKMGTTKREGPLQGTEANSSNGDHISPPARTPNRQDSGTNLKTEAGRDGTSSSPEAPDRVGRRRSEAFVPVGLTDRQMLALAMQQSLTDSNNVNQRVQVKRSRSPSESESSEQNKVPRRPQPKSPRSPTSPNGKNRRDEEMSRPKKVKSFKEEPGRSSREEQGPVIPDEFHSWPEDRQALWKGVSQDPDAYYFKYLAPGEVEKSSGWTEVEKRDFMQALKEHPPKTVPKVRWGIFSMRIPTKTGYQCMQYFEDLRRRGLVTNDDLDGLKADLSIHSAEEKDHSEDNGCNLSTDDHRGNHSSAVAKSKTPTMDNLERDNGAVAKNSPISTADKTPATKEKNCEMEPKPIKVVEIQASGTRRKQKNTWIRSNSKLSKVINHEPYNGAPRDGALSGSNLPKEDGANNAKRSIDALEDNKPTVLLTNAKENNVLERQSKSELRSGSLPSNSDLHTFVKEENPHESSGMNYRSELDDNSTCQKSTQGPVTDSVPRENTVVDGTLEPKEDDMHFGPARSTTIEASATDRSKERLGSDAVVTQLQTDDISILSEDPVIDPRNSPRSPELDSDLFGRKQAFSKDVAGEVQSGVESSDLNGLKSANVKSANEEADFQTNEADKLQDAQPVSITPISQNSERQDTDAKEPATALTNEFEHTNGNLGTPLERNGLPANEPLSQVMVIEPAPLICEPKEQVVEAVEEKVERSVSSSGPNYEGLDNSVKDDKVECQEYASDENSAEKIVDTGRSVPLTKLDENCQRSDNDEAVVTEAVSKANEPEFVGADSMSEDLLHKSSNERDEVAEKNPNDYIHYVGEICNSRKWTTLNVEGACKVLLAEFHIAQPDGVYREARGLAKWQLNL